MNQRGVTMIESLVALVILSVGMLGIAGLYVSGVKAGRSALLRTQAVNLASDMADRIRANRRAVDAYDMDTYAGAPEDQGCINAGCTPEELAEDDLFRWQAAVIATLPGRPTPVVDVEVEELAAEDADRYTVTVTWHEAGEDQPSTYTLVVEV
ncbi:MAG: type IV pilus modification protein PilV [Steroidobacteraceae bacterium]